MSILKFIATYLKIGVLLFSLLSFAQAKAQTADSLLREMKKIESDSERLVALEDICHDYIWSNPIVADSLIDAVAVLAKKQKSAFYLAMSHSLKGILAENRQKLKLAFTHYTKARKVLEKLDSSRALAVLYYNMGLVHFRLKENEECRKLVEKAREINLKKGNIDLLIGNEIMLVILEKDPLIQIKRYQLLDSISRKHQHLGGIFLSAFNTAYIYNDEENFDSAHFYLKKAEKLMNQDLKDKHLHQLYQLRGRVYEKQKRYPKAILFLEKALAQSKKKDWQETTLQVYKNLARIHVVLKNHKTAYAYLEKYNRLNANLDLQKKSKAIAEMEMDYQLENKENENKLLRKEAELNANKLQTGKRQRILLGLLLLITLVAIALITLQYNTRQKHYNEIKKGNAKLNELNLEMESVLQVVSHDFRTPLTKVKMLGEMIRDQEQGSLSDNAKDKLEKIESSINEAETLVLDILELKSFYEGEEYVSNPIGFNIQEEIELVIEQYKKPIELKGLKLSYTHQGDKAVILEKELLIRVVSNLISNAVKFTQEKQEIWIKSKNEAEILTIQVRDSGPGFSEEDKKMLFQKFAKIGNKPISWGTSHGLGLYIVKKLVDRLDGRIEVFSRSGEGAEFTVTVNSVVQ